MMSNIQKITKGFTLIETLVAVLLLASAIAGPLTIASRGLTAALVAKDQVIAYYLLQDAIEYVRFKRDTNTLAGDPWLTGLDSGGCVDTANGCNIDSLADTITPCSGACTAMKFDTISSAYDTSGTQLPAFTRTIKLTQLTTEEVAMEVTVSWSDIGSVVHTLTAKENIYDW